MKKTNLENKQTKADVPQESVLGPHLFKIT